MKIVTHVRMEIKHQLWTVPYTILLYQECHYIKNFTNTQGRSTVKGQMGHVSTSFCVSKDNFDQFWEQTLNESKELGIEDPKLKRKEKIQKNS